MASLKKQVIGKISGKVGDLIFRNRNDNNYIALKPIRVNSPKDERAISRRMKFKSATQLASAINSIIPLKMQWTYKTSGNNSVYNRLVKANYPTLISSLPSEFSVLTPPKGFGVITQTISVNETEIKVGIDAIGTNAGINPVVEKTIRLAAVLCLSGPPNPMYSDVVYLPFISEQQTLNLNSALTFQIALNINEAELFNLYSTKKLLAGFITFDVDSLPISHSETIYHQQ
jgi:hypothetical protein